MPARTVCTEWGGPMSPGSKNGVSYGTMDYSQTPTNYFEAYLRGAASQLRTWNMGSFYWAGLKDGDWYSMTIKSGSGSNITLSIPNQSGLERMQYAWTSSAGTGGTDGGAGGSAGSGGAGAGGSGGTKGHGGADGRLGGSSMTSSGGAGGRTAGGADASGVGGASNGGTVASDGATDNAGGAGGGTGGSGGTVGSSGGAVTTGGATSGSGGVVGTGGASVGSGLGTGGLAVGSGGAGSGGSGTGGASYPSTVPGGQTSGCSCGIEQSSRGSNAVLALLLGFVAIAAVRRKSGAAGGRENM